MEEGGGACTRRARGKIIWEEPGRRPASIGVICAILKTLLGALDSVESSAQSMNTSGGPRSSAQNITPESQRKFEFESLNHGSVMMSLDPQAPRALDSSLLKMMKTD